MFIGLPFILIYIYKRKGFQEEISSYIKTFMLSSLIFYIPYMTSYGFIKMVFGTFNQISPVAKTPAISVAPIPNI